MPRFCSKCGLAGHSRRNASCRITVIQHKYQLIAAEIEACPFPYQKLDILDRKIPDIHTQFSAALRNYSLSEQTMTFYYGLFLESKTNHRNTKKYGIAEEILVAHQEMQCAEASYKVMMQSFLSDMYLKDVLIVELRKLNMMHHIIMSGSIKHTSDYLKEMTLLVHDDLTQLEDLHTTCECPLCYDTVLVTDALHTNCSHSYCAECVKNLATSIKDKTTQPSCPCCRTTITEITTGNPDILVNFRFHLLRL